MSSSASSDIKYILSIDPATSTGWAIFEVHDGVTTKKDHGIIVFTHNSEGELMSKIYKWVTHVCKKFGIKYIALENYFFSSRAKQGANINLYIRGAMMMASHDLGIPYDIINITDWKYHICGTKRPTKELIARMPGKTAKTRREKANKEMVREAIRDRWNFQLSSHMVSESGNLVTTKSDELDAIAIGIYFCFFKFHSIMKPLNGTLPEPVVPENKVLNPATGRWVLKTSPIGKKLLAST